MVLGAGVVSINSSASGISDVEGCCGSGPSAGGGGLLEEVCRGLLIPVPERSWSVSAISVSTRIFVI